MTDYAADATDPRMVAAIDILGRSGAKSFQLRYSEDPEPMVWIADCEWKHERECAASLSPLGAALRLVRECLTGGTCAHCSRETRVTDDWRTAPTSDPDFCWYVYDPELETFRRSCEGDEDQYRGIGRNDPCPCGSGEKFKRCHGER